MGRIRQKPQDVRRVVFKEIPPGDFKKFIAESNISNSGGGARDLRFRPHRDFGPIFGRMFPERKEVYRRRGGITTLEEVFVGTLAWKETENGLPQRARIQYEPPTDAREDEGRIARVHELWPFNHANLSVDEGRVLLLLVEDDGGEVWPYFRTEQELSTKPWAESVRVPILACLAKPRRSGAIARGYIDFTLGVSDCCG